MSTHWGRHEMPDCRRYFQYFQIHILERNVVILFQILLNFLFLTVQLIDKPALLGSEQAQNRQQTIMWTNDGVIKLGLDAFKSSFSVSNCSTSWGKGPTRDWTVYQ